MTTHAIILHSPSKNSFATPHPHHIPLATYPFLCSSALLSPSIALPTLSPIFLLQFPWTNRVSLSLLYQTALVQAPSQHPWLVQWWVFSPHLTRPLNSMWHRWWSSSWNAFIPGFLDTTLTCYFCYRTSLLPLSHTCCFFPPSWLLKTRISSHSQQVLEESQTRSLLSSCYFFPPTPFLQPWALPVYNRVFLAAKGWCSLGQLETTRTLGWYKLGSTSLATLSLVKGDLRSRTPMLPLIPGFPGVSLTPQQAFSDEKLFV